MLKKTRMRLEELEQEADGRLSDALRKGNRADLEKQKRVAIQGRKSAEKDATQAARDQTDLFKSELLGKRLLAAPFKRSQEMLNGLHRQGKIPSQTIPVLEDR